MRLVAKLLWLLVEFFSKTPNVVLSFTPPGDWSHVLNTVTLRLDAHHYRIVIHAAF